MKNIHSITWVILALGISFICYTIGAAMTIKDCPSIVFTYYPEDLVELISIDKQSNNVLKQHNSFMVEGHLNINNEVFTDGFIGCTLSIRDKERLLSNFNVTKANTVVTITANYDKQGEYLGQKIDTLKLPVNKESIQI